MNHADVLSVLSYTPEAGTFMWLVARGRCAAGAAAGYNADRGYRGIRVFGKCLYAHRLAFFYMTGRWPHEIDHIDGDRSNNRWANLREVTRDQNLQNGSLPSHNRSGVVGVFWNAGKRKWTARIKVRQVTHHLGDFDDLGVAAAARKAAEREHGFHPNHGKRQ